MFIFLFFFNTATHISLVSKAVPKARSCLSAHSSLAPCACFAHSFPGQWTQICVCLLIPVHLRPAAGVLWGTLLTLTLHCAEARTSWSRSYSAAQGVTQCVCITAGDKCLSPWVWTEPVSSGLRNSQADAGEIALLRVCHLEQLVWITTGNWRDQFVGFHRGRLAYCPQQTALHRFWYSVDL